MNADVTRMLEEIRNGSRQASEEFLPLVYEELRKLAAHRIAQENPGGTLQATALVHEAYLRLIGSGEQESWDNRGHFFAAAAESMRRILVDAARRKARLKRGGDRQRQELVEDAIVAPGDATEVLAVHEALDKLEKSNEEAFQLVRLRYFAGLTIPDTAAAIGISPRKANQVWAYAKAWLMSEIGYQPSGHSPD